ncbi:1,4-beta-xylanase [Flavobacterium akiainvivens]|uniref:1,4-beta-xylanase n=1 Tax=Flavobacterium akiainvivens TaxID=1202724 RepID=A0A0M8M8N2_9FLAO|nr:cellulase family glycosylhydrolase [Flavobacterium akiainvivens]KOS05823.1 1,4-beta-xylanase [Flavobacterium akiainvivens]SFQ57117.1 Cellulase (glycosyl hydrolase family 5) [Flavobacterium akiainvivens]
MNTVKVLKNTPFALALAAGLMLFSCKDNKEAEKKDEKATTEVVERKIWTKEEANQWYAQQPWYVGANFTNSNAINTLEMFQADTFDPAAIDKELGWAESIGMNCMRVYLHDLLHQQDPEGFYKRVEEYLAIADKHHIKTLFVLFDSCWDPFPVLGKQRAPKPHVHNSGSAQAPGQKALLDSTQYPRLEKYVKETVARFKDDKRVLGWDVWNEPDNMTGPSYEKVEIKNKVELIGKLLPQVFDWARSANPSQPVTSGVWQGDWSEGKINDFHKMQLEQSDIITFHCYDKPQDFENRIKQLERFGKPMICTEYMARPNGSTFEGFLPVAKKYNVGMINWGLVDGKMQTKYPWDSWTKTYTAEPPVWFHDVFHTDGTPYIKAETDFIKKITSEVNKK